VTPEQIGAVSAVVTLFDMIGSTPILTLFAIMIIGPWVVLVLVTIAHHRRFEAVVTMYTNNYAQTEEVVKLAETVRDAAEQYRKLSTYTVTQVVKTREAVESNMHCPLVREKAKPKDFSHGG